MGVGHSLIKVAGLFYLAELNCGSDLNFKSTHGGKVKRALLKLTLSYFEENQVLFSFYVSY